MSQLGREEASLREHGLCSGDLRFGDCFQERPEVVLTLAQHLGHSESGMVTEVQSLLEKPNPL